MKTTLPPDLEGKLADFRRRVWIVKLAEGILAAIFGLVVSYLLVFVLDRFGETPAWLRFCLLLAGAATLGLGLPLKWHRWVWRQRQLEDVARLLRLKFPRLGDQLLGIVELVRREEGASGRSEQLVKAAIEQTAEAVKERDFSQAVPDARHWQWGWAAAGVFALAVVAFVVVNPAARNALVRWLEPWRNVERFTFADVEPLPAKIVVPYDEPFQFSVKLSPGTEWSPSEGTGRIANQPPVKANLAAGTYPFTFPPQTKDADLALSLGDARKNVAVEPKTRPELADITAHLKLPAYLGYTSEQTVDVRDGSIGVVKGAAAAFEARAIRDIASATMDSQPQQVQGGKIITGYETVNADLNRQFNWKDSDGLTPREPLTLKIKAVDDEPPRIATRRETLEEVVLDSEVVNFNLTGTDDFGVKEMGLEWTGSEMGPDGKTPVHGEKIVAAGGPEKKQVEAVGTFCATREGVAPQTVEVRAWVVDYYPGRPHVHSASFILHVLNKTDHALWLTEQFGKWLEAAKETYEREQQLNATNKDLRAMSPSDLDRPENRRKVAQQAAEENANASRLTSLTDSGSNLVEQATKNDEFDAKRLESWATMLKTLKDIAANRMPSVSDLLRQTAAAPAGNTPPTNPSRPNSPSPNAPQATPPNGKTVANVSNGQTPPGAAPPKSIDPNAPPKPAAPSISDNEPGMSKPPAPKPNPNAPPSPPSGGHLTLPNTTLGAAPNQKPGDQPPPPASPAQQSMQDAVTQQNDLLAEFAKVADQLGDILTSLEASTFVKRFKAASREQMKLAGNISQKTLDSFGIVDAQLDAAPPIVKEAKDQSEVVNVIQSDLDAYYQRKQDPRFKTTLDEMKKSQIVQALAGDGDRVSSNLTGEGMTGSQYWADTLDRWAEEMVAASNSKASSSRTNNDSLPPEIVLKVMKALRDEIKLRDETRENENAKPAVTPEVYTAGAKNLAETQIGISGRTSDAMSDILALPDGAQHFGKEVKLLKDVVGAMNDAHNILESGSTDSPAVAAETDAIEMLLQTKRSGNKPGGGGGGANPGGGGRGTTSDSALADFGPGSDAKATVQARPVGQDTGVAGQKFPDEFKAGLDSYFGLLEKQAAGK